jgi:hypothetical protein
MNGCCGTEGADIDLGLAVEPMNEGTLFASGPSGIGTAASLATAIDTLASRAAAAIAMASDAPVNRLRDANAVSSSTPP